MTDDRERLLLTHVEYIRESIDELKQGREYDRTTHARHEQHDDERFGRVEAQLNKFAGGLALLVILLGLLPKLIEAFVK